MASITEKAPRIAKLWHPTLNGDVLASEVPSGRKLYYWWQCNLGHEWQSKPSSMTRYPESSPCPFCAGRKVLIGFNDLSSNNPRLASEWHPTKNGTLLPTQVTPSSSKKVFWLGKCGHDWEDTVCERNRPRSNKGCRVCSGAEILVGFNDFETTHPEVAKYWHPTKNNIPPQGITGGVRSRKFWWLGDCGHEWQAKPSAMTSLYRTGSGCPFCSGKKLLIGFNDLKTRYPMIALEWHQTLNGTLLPEDIVSGSGQNVWWRCSKGHDWQATAALRTSGKKKCSECFKNTLLKRIEKEKVEQEKLDRRITMKNNKKPKPIVIHREKEIEKLVEDINLIKEWHPTKNKRSLENKLPFSTSIWWICQYKHEWKASIRNRLSGGKNNRPLGCRTCSGRTFLSGFNDISTTNPELAKEWHPTLNQGILPSDIQSGSNRISWWVCDKNHVWSTSPNSRLKRSDKDNVTISNCPTCVGRITLPGFNDILTTRPDLIEEWDYSKNLDITPEMLTQWSGVKVWWQCKAKKHHKWEAVIYSRSGGRKCPHCNGYKSKIELEFYEELLKFHPDAESGTRLPVKWGKSGCSQVDIYIPSLELAVEYDGWYWHERKFEADILKTRALIEAGYKVLRIREAPLLFLDLNNECLSQIKYSKEKVNVIVKELFENSD